MIPGIYSKLLEIESEAVNAGESDTLFDAVDHRAFSSYSERVLAIYQLQFPGITAGWVSVAGFEPGILTPLAASSPDVLGRVPDLQKATARALAPNWVEDLTTPGANRYLIAPSPNARQAMVIRLRGHDEYYGLMVLCSDASSYLDATIVSEIRETLPLLNRVMAEQNFSMRLSRLAAPFEFDKGLATRETMYQQIVRLACRGFAADGAVLRFRRPSADEPSGYALDVVAREGRVSDAQIAQDDAGHRICLEVLTSEVGITVQSFQNGVRVGLGAEIRDSDDAGLRAFGVESVHDHEAAIRSHRRPSYWHGNPLGLPSHA